MTWFFRIRNLKKFITSCSNFMLDIKLTQLGLKMKNLIVVDLSFPQPALPEFKKNYDPRYLWMPCKEELALSFATGLASFGKLVVLYGATKLSIDELDPTVNVKVLKHDAEALWQDFEGGLRRFGPELLLIPE